jgi:hypothetical protein
MTGAIASGSGEENRPPEARLQRKIKETKQVASKLGFDLATAPLLVTFEMPLWGPLSVAHEMASLARRPGTAAAVLTTDPLPAAREKTRPTPYLHVIAETGLMCGLTGGATLHIYPPNVAEEEAFAVALFAGCAARSLRLSLSALISCGRQEATFEAPAGGPALRGREILTGVRDCGGSAVYADEGENAVVIAEAPAELVALRRYLAGPSAGRAVRVSRLPSGRFRVQGEAIGHPVDPAAIQAAAQGIAISCDRYVEMRGPTTFAFSTEPVARARRSPRSSSTRPTRSSRTSGSRRSRRRARSSSPTRGRRRSGRRRARTSPASRCTTSRSTGGSWTRSDGGNRDVERASVST